jgi:hypothetical protein
MAYRSDYTIPMVTLRLACLVSVVLMCEAMTQGQVLPDPVEARSATDATLLEAGSNSQEASRSRTDGQPGSYADTPKRILGIIPNFRTFPTLKDYKPITPKQKFKIATQDSFDYGTVILSALFAGLGQVTDSTPSFGQGGSSYAKYFAGSLTDFVVGNYMTEAIYPTILHQDPRYFRSGTGSTWSRLGLAARQILWTRADSGHMQFNFSEILGNSTAVAISNAYYPDNRNASDAARKVGFQLGVDIASNILKEFSPELSHVFAHKHSEKSASK